MLELLLGDIAVFRGCEGFVLTQLNGLRIFPFPSMNTLPDYTHAFRFTKYVGRYRLSAKSRQKALMKREWHTTISDPDSPYRTKSKKSRRRARTLNLQ